METTIGIYLVTIIGIYGLIFSIKKILIGKGKIKHPMYDTEEKKKSAYRMGIVCTIGSALCTGFYLVMSILFTIY